LAAKEPPAASGLTGALVKIVEGLRGHPPLLYGLGGGILIVSLAGAVGGIAADQLWLFVVALVVLVLAGLGAWLVASDRALDALKVKGSARLGGKTRTLSDSGSSAGRSRKKISIGGDLTMTEEARLGSDDVTGSASEPDVDEPMRAPDSRS
jgi:hypothetical protein